MPGIPERGDIGWLDFNPQTGREQAGRRPALVISPGAYNAKSGLMLVCPLTRKVKGYPFEWPIPAELGEGVVLCDQLSIVDWRARNFDFMTRVSDSYILDVIARIDPLVQG